MNRISSLISAAAIVAIATQSVVASAAREVVLCANFSRNPVPRTNVPCGIEGFGDTESDFAGGNVGSTWHYKTDLILSEGFQVAAGLSLMQSNGQRVTKQGSVVLCPEATDINPTPGVISFETFCTVGQHVQFLRHILARTT